MTIKWSFSYYFFVKLSLYNIMHLLITLSFTMSPKRNVIKRLHCITTALIAQLAEHPLLEQEVIGLNPVSTIQKV